MKILIVSQYYFPEQFQINDIAPGLVRRGHEVTVLCGLPNYPQGRIYPGYADVSKRDEVIDGVRVIRCRQVPRGHNPLSLALNYRSFARNARKIARNLPADFDIVIGYQLSPVTSMLPALDYAKRHGTPLLMYCLDLWPVSAQSHLPLKRGLLYTWLHGLSRKIYRGFDRIAVTSKPFIGYLHEVNGVPEDRISYLPQHADPSMLETDLTAEDNGVADFMYAGNLGAGATLEVIVKAAKVLGPRKDYRIHFVGDGSRRKALEALVAEYGLQDNFIFYGNRKRAEMPDFYRKADVLLISLRGNNAVGDTMPGKLQMYMTVGKPILGAINGAAREVIAEAGCGRCVPAGDHVGLAAAMLAYMEHPEEYAACGERARAYFRREFTFEKYMDGLEAEIHKLTKHAV